MQSLNYLHLYHFWFVAKEGTIAAACEHLFLTPPTLSTQIRDLEKALKAKLFQRSGRNLVLTEAGQIVYRYANGIFNLGNELVLALKGAPTGHPMRLSIGAQDTIPKLIVYQLLKPVFDLDYPVRFVCYEGTPDQLLPRLSIHEVDMVLSDAPMSPLIKVSAYTHLLGESGIAWFAGSSLARKLRRGFPTSLDGAPTLLPAKSTAMRTTLEAWFHNTKVQPNVIAEFEDIELMMAFGRDGRGCFPAHDIIADEIAREQNVQRIGGVKGRSERFYLISVERQLKHPAVVALTKSARETIFN